MSELYSHEAERALCGGLMLSDRDYWQVRGIIAPGDFYGEKCRLVFEAIGDLASHDKPATHIQVADALKTRRVEAGRGQIDALSHVGGIAFLAELLSEGQLNPAPLAKTIQRHAVRRRLMEVGQRIVERAKADGEAAQLVADSESDLLALSSMNLTGAPLQLLDLVREQQGLLAQPLENGLVGIPTGSRPLDLLTNGFQAGKVYVIVGRPGSGKSTKATWHGYQAAKAGYWAHEFSLEMPGDEIGLRMLAHLSGLDSMALQRRRKVRDGRFVDLEFEDHENARLALRGASVPFTFDTEIYDFERILSRARTLAREGVRLFIFDYLLLMETGKRFDRDDIRIGHYTRSLKQLAKATRTPVILLTQYRKENQTQRPTKEDIYGASFIENDADYIELLYSPVDVGEVPDALDYKDREKHVELISGIVAKHRGGRTGLVNYTFRKATSTYEDWPREFPITLTKGGSR